MNLYESFKKSLKESKNDPILQEIYDNLQAGISYGEDMDKEHHSWITYPYFDAVLYRIENNGRGEPCIGWRHYGSSANPNTIEDLNWIITTIFEMTPEEFVQKYIKNTESKLEESCNKKELKEMDNSEGLTNTQFVEYCKDKLADLGTATVKNFDDEDVDVKVAFEQPIRDYGMCKVLDSADTIDKLDSDGETLEFVDEKGEYHNSPMISSLTLVGRLEFDKIDNEFYKAVLQYWDDISDFFESGELKECNASDKANKFAESQTQEIDANEPNDMDTVRKYIEDCKDHPTWGSILVDTFSNDFPGDPLKPEDIGKVVYDLRVYPTEKGYSADFERYEVIEADPEEGYENNLKYDSDGGAEADGFDINMSDEEVQAFGNKFVNGNLNESQTQEIEGIMEDLRKDIPNIDKYMKEYYAEIAKEEPRPSYDKEKDEMNPEWEKWNSEKNNILYSDKAWNNFANWVKNKYNENINESEKLKETDTTSPYIDLSEIIKYAEEYLCNKLNCYCSITRLQDGQYQLTIPNTHEAVSNWLEVHEKFNESEKLNEGNYGSIWLAEILYNGVVGTCRGIGKTPEEAQQNAFALFRKDYPEELGDTLYKYYKEKGLDEKIENTDYDHYDVNDAFNAIKWWYDINTFDMSSGATNEGGSTLKEAAGYNYIGTDTGEAGRNDKSHMEHTFTVYDCFGEVETFKSKEEAEKYIEEHKDDDLYTDPDYGCENGPEFRIEEDDIEVNNKKIVVKDDLEESEKEVVKSFKDDKEGLRVDVVKAPNGKFFNYYYSSDKDHWDSSAGPFTSADEAIKMAKKHRPTVKESEEKKLAVTSWTFSQ